MHTKCTRWNDGKMRFLSYICRCKSVIIHFQPFYNNDEQRIDPHSDDVFRRVCQDMFPEVCHLLRSRAPIRILVVLSSQLYCQYNNPRTRLSDGYDQHRTRPRRTLRTLYADRLPARSCGIRTPPSRHRSQRLALSPHHHPHLRLAVLALLLCQRLCSRGEPIRQEPKVRTGDILTSNDRFGLQPKTVESTLRRVVAHPLRINQKTLP